MHGVAEGDCSPTTGIDELATWPDEIRRLAEASCAPLSLVARACTLSPARSAPVVTKTANYKACCSPRQHQRPTFAQIAGALAAGERVADRSRLSRQSTFGSDLSRSEHQVDVAPPSYAETGSSAEGSARRSGRLSEMVGKFVGNLFSSGM